MVSQGAGTAPVWSSYSNYVTMVQRTSTATRDQAASSSWSPIILPGGTYTVNVPAGSVSAGVGSTYYFSEIATNNPGLEVRLYGGGTADLGK